MPGVHAVGAIDNGRTTQTIYLKGAGYGLIGLVTTDAEKNALRRHAGDDWPKLPYMTMTALYEHEDEDDALTIAVVRRLIWGGHACTHASHIRESIIIRDSLTVARRAVSVWILVLRCGADVGRLFHHPWPKSNNKSDLPTANRYNSNNQISLQSLPHLHYTTLH